MQPHIRGVPEHIVLTIMFEPDIWATWFVAGITVVCTLSIDTHHDHTCDQLEHGHINQNGQN